MISIQYIRQLCSTATTNAAAGTILAKYIEYVMVFSKYRSKTACPWDFGHMIYLNL